MTEYERGYREALEAAALIVQTAPVQIDGSTTGPMQNLASAILGTFRPGIAAAIRALVPRIPPAPDGEIERLTRQLDAARQVERNVQKAREAEFARATAAEAERDALREALGQIADHPDRAGNVRPEFYRVRQIARAALGSKP